MVRLFFVSITVVACLILMNGTGLSQGVRLEKNITLSMANEAASAAGDVPHKRLACFCSSRRSFWGAQGPATGRWSGLSYS